MCLRVNAIAPGMFRTRMTEAILNRAGSIVASATPLGRSRRQLQGKSAPLSRCALYLDRTLVFLHNALDNGQAKSAPAAVTRARAIRAIEALEDVRQIAGRNTNTCIADFHDCIVGAGS